MPDREFPPQVHVRPARTEDVPSIVEFNRRLARETEERDLDAAVLTRGVRRALEDADRGTYAVAELDGRQVGCLLLTREWSDWRDGWFWWIQSVYVEPEARGRGVFTALWADALARARSAPDVRGVRLYVERENADARAVYERLGMGETSYRLYELELDGRDAGA